MLTALLLTTINSQIQFLPIEIPNIVWVRPAPTAGSYIVAAQEWQGYAIHWWPKRVDRKPLRVSSPWISGSEASERYVTSLFGSSEISDFENWSVTDNGYRKTTWLDGQRIDIETQDNGKTSLTVGGKRIAPPSGQRFVLLSDDGNFVVTERVKDGVAGSESQYSLAFQLWGVRHSSIKFVRSLGDIWYDAASTGEPSVLSVSGNGLAVVDIPSGGGVLQLPVLCDANGKRSSLDSLGLGGYVTLTDSPTAFDQGLLLPVEVFENVEVEDLEFPGLKYQPWLVWYSKQGAFALTPPIGFLNVFKVGPMSALLAVHVKGGIELRPLQLPPRDWYEIKLTGYRVP